MGEQSDLEKRLIERADQAIELGLLAIPMVMQEAAAAIAGLREACDGTIKDLALNTPFGESVGFIADAMDRSRERLRNALAGLSAAPGREGVDGA